jgi:hypothetical protein
MMHQIIAMSEDRDAVDMAVRLLWGNKIHASTEVVTVSEFGVSVKATHAQVATAILQRDVAAGE